MEIVGQVLRGIFNSRKNEILAHFRKDPAGARHIESRLDGQWSEIEDAVNGLAEDLAMGRGGALALPKRDSLEDGVPV